MFQFLLYNYLIIISFKNVIYSHKISLLVPVNFNKISKLHQFCNIILITLLVAQKAPRLQILHKKRVGNYNYSYKEFLYTLLSFLNTIFSFCPIVISHNLSFYLRDREPIIKKQPLIPLCFPFLAYFKGA